MNYKPKEFEPTFDVTPIKRSKRIGCLLTVLLTFLATVVVCGFGLYWLIPKGTDPLDYVDHISKNPETYAKVESASVEDLSKLYDWRRLHLVDAFDGSTRRPKIADENGRVPVFKCDGHIFIHLHRWKHFRSGLAISTDEQFQSKVELADDRILVRHIVDDIYEWSYDIER